ncbi:protein of unknown function [Paenibacillus sp. yr247]|uniref:3D domain-containing protein n=1 Tax=Paenibacillus sp. yr247 TaxID=1761880 RepID=UPI00087E1C1E|nr:3D domain-containing protein [Paenibacillus sp. yr247]SDP08536.1 protein of unknown function [Paenibacillus sp. yr247]
MGAFKYEETQLKRSSGMSLALRWKHKNLKFIMITAFLSVLGIFGLLLLLYGTSAKYVTLVVNGQEKKVYTRQWVMARFLEEQGIAVVARDRLSASPESKLANGERVTIEHTVPVQLTADGETKTMYTTGKTVERALQDLNVTLGNLDKVTPDLHASVSENTAIKVVRVHKTVNEVAEPIEYQVETKYDPNLPAGKEQTIQEGKEGVLLKNKITLFEDGALVTETIEDKFVSTESVNKIVAVGTQKPVSALSASGQVSKNGVTFPVKQIMKNITLTAFTAGVASTGKSNGDAEYGITFTGTHVTEGRTIAVDPNVIPLGWWVYIEGIGFRRAEDTGSAIKGQKIDVYYESESYANRFGVKRGVTVYVIGPKKPSLE